MRSVYLLAYKWRLEFFLEFLVYQDTYRFDHIHYCLFFVWVCHFICLCAAKFIVSEFVLFVLYECVVSEPTLPRVREGQPVDASVSLSVRVEV